MKKNHLSLKKREAIQGWLSVLPALIIVLVMTGYPAIQTIIKSFTNWNGIGTSEWVGFDNYTSILKDPQTWKLLLNCIIFLLFIPIQLFLGISIAVLIHDGIPGGKIFRIIYYIPQVISAVVVGFLFRTMFGYDGAINTILEWLGIIKEAIPWLERGGTARAVVIFVLVWVNIGWQCLLALGGLSSIQPSVYEAATLDGAGFWTKLFKITIPMLGRTIEYSCVTSVMWTFTGTFTYIFSLTSGGPGYETSTLEYMIYRLAFKANSQYGYASALAVILIVIVLVLTVVQLRVSNRQNDWEE